MLVLKSERLNGWPRSLRLSRARWEQAAFCHLTCLLSSTGKLLINNIAGTSRRTWTFLTILVGLTVTPVNINYTCPKYQRQSQHIIVM